MTTPIGPNEVKLEDTIPDFVIDTVNQLIKRNWDGKRSVFTLKTVKEIVKLRIDANTELRNNWFNFEDLYRERGWIVKYEFPEGDDNWDSHYTFTK